MVAIKSHEADRFLANLPDHIFLFLVFGTDSGLVSERKRALLHRKVSDPNDAFQIVEMTGDEIAADPLRLLDEANSVSLFGGKRALSIEVGPKSVLGALEGLIRMPPRDCAVVLFAGALKRDSPLRNLIERERLGAAIECLPDGPSDIDELIQSSATAEGIQIDPDARRLLTQMLGSDRLVTRAEVKKLLLYTHGSKVITRDDVEAIVADASILAIDAIVTAAFVGDKAGIDESAAGVFRTGGDANMLLAFVLRHAIALKRARLEMDLGAGMDQAVQSLMRGGTFARKDAISRQLRIWTMPKLVSTIARIVDAVGNARREPKLAEISTVRALWAIAHTADAKRL